MSEESKFLEAKITDLFRKEYTTGEDFLKELEEIKKSLYKTKDIGNFYSTLLNIIAHIDLPEDEAKIHWENIVKRYKEISEKIGRTVSIRTAIIDYFTYNTEIIKNPVIIEIFLYDAIMSKSYIDGMTGLYNYRYFKEVLWSETKRSERYNLFFSIVVIDIDDLKSINSQYGFDKGNEIIKTVAKVISINKRSEDTVFRYNDDEFIIILPETSKSGAIAFISRIKRKLGEQFEKIGINITVSAGIAEYPSDSKDPVNLMELAFKALYSAKYKGKNRIVGYTQEI